MAEVCSTRQCGLVCNAYSAHNKVVRYGKGMMEDTSCVRLLSRSSQLAKAVQSSVECDWVQFMHIHLRKQSPLCGREADTGEDTREVTWESIEGVLGRKLGIGCH